MPARGHKFVTRRCIAGLTGAAALLFPLVGSSQSRSALSDSAHRDPIASSQAAASPLDSLSAALGSSFRRYHTEHFEMLSDCDAGTVRRVLELAEDTFRGASRFIAKLELPHRPPAGRMPMLLFERYSGYERHARLAGFPASESVPGYFDEATGICALFNFANSTAVRTQRDQLWRRERELASQNRASNESNHAAAGPAQKALEAARRALEAAQRAVIATVVRHEIAHQVLAATGVQSTSAGAARWLIEGTAMLFENADGPNAYRLADAMAIPAGERLALFRRVVGDPRELGPGAAGASAAYASAWALVYYLAETQPRALVDFLTATRTGAKDLDAFERRFGELDAAFVERVYAFLEARNP